MVKKNVVIILNLSSGSVAAYALFKKNGEYAKSAAVFSRKDLGSNILIGRLTFMIEFPVKRLTPIFLARYRMTPL